MNGFWQGKRVLLTGDTGFKGCWMALWLHSMGAKVYGFSLPPEANQPSLFSLIEADKLWNVKFGNIQFESELVEVVKASDPEVVIHMAAQAIVGKSYQDPVDTFATNLMGTVNLLSALKNHAAPKLILAVTSDKVYENNDTGKSFSEDDRLGGDDPYSASKACAELAINSWRASYFSKVNIPLISVRASNVIGGGDWSHDRLIPNYIRSINTSPPATFVPRNGPKGDFESVTGAHPGLHEGASDVSARPYAEVELCNRAAQNPSFIMRNPNSVRAWQHVMDTIGGYLIYAQKAYEQDTGLANSLNFGPPSAQALTASHVINLMQEYMHYPTVIGTKKHIENYSSLYPEKNTLLIDSSKAEKILAWTPLLSPQQAIYWTAKWYNGYFAKKDIYQITVNQIHKYEEMQNAKEPLSSLPDAVRANIGRSWQNAVGQ